MSEALDRRPQLRAALSEARKPKCSMVVVDPFSLDPFGMLAEKERPMISAGTNAALAAAKARG